MVGEASLHLCTAPLTCCNHARCKTKTDDNFGSRLHEASRYGRHDWVQQLLAAGAVVDAMDGDDCAPLFYAVEGGHSSVVQVLLAACDDVEVGRDGGATPLIAAAFEGRTEIVRQLLAAGAMVDPEQDASIAPIHDAAMAEDFEVVHLLLQTGALPWVGSDDAFSDGGHRTLSGAARDGHVAVVQLLLEAWGQPAPPTAELVQAAAVVAGWNDMAALARLAKALRKHCPAIVSEMFEPNNEDPDFLAAAVAGALKEWASDVSKKDEQRAALCEREEAVAREQQALQQLVVHVAGIAKGVGCHHGISRAV